MRITSQRLALQLVAESPGGCHELLLPGVARRPPSKASPKQWPGRPGRRSRRERRRDWRPARLRPLAFVRCRFGSGRRSELRWVDSHVLLKGVLGERNDPVGSGARCLVDEIVEAPKDPAFDLRVPARPPFREGQSSLQSTTFGIEVSSTFCESTSMLGDQFSGCSIGGHLGARNL